LVSDKNEPVDIKVKFFKQLKYKDALTPKDFDEAREQLSIRQAKRNEIKEKLQKAEEENRISEKTKKTCT